MSQCGRAFALVSTWYRDCVLRSTCCLSDQQSKRCAVDAVELDRVLTATLLAEASEGITSVAMELTSLYDSWVARADCPDAVAWLRRMLEQLGWWAGRLDCASDPSLVAKFPRLD